MPVNAKGLRLLVLASRPSDYTEMSDLARALAAGGHYPSLIYFYSPTDPGIQGILSDMEALAGASVVAQPVDINEVPRPAAAVADAAAPVTEVELKRPSRSATEGLLILVQVLRDRVLGRELAFKLRDRLPTVRRYFPVIYQFARGIDIIRNVPGGVVMGWRALQYRLARSRDIPIGTRIRVILMGPKALADADTMEQIYRRFLEFFRDLIRISEADALLIPEDIVGNLWPVAIRAGHDEGVPALVLPYTLANKQEAFQSLKDVPGYQTGPNRIAAILHPRWRLSEAGADLVRLPAPHIHAHERLGIAPPDPWMMNSGYSDKILVDSKASLEYFLAGGIPRDQLSVVGSVSQDRMFQLRQNRAAHLEQLRRDLGLAGEKPLLLISGCPNQLTSPVPFCEFSSISEVASHVGESLAPLAADYHLVVRAHPNFPEFGPLLAPFGVVTSTQPTSSLVPLADVFVAFASATIRWAIACGIPTVNYDVFHYGYGEFASANGVSTASAGDKFRDLVRSLVPGSAALHALWSLAQADGAHWSVMDGQGLSRIEAEIWRARERRGAKLKESVPHA